VHTGQIVYINDTALFTTLSGGKETETQRLRTDVQLRIFIDLVDASSGFPPLVGSLVSDAVFTAYSGLFAGNPSVPVPAGKKPLRFGQGEGVGLVRDVTNPAGCQAYTQTFANEAILVHRGECTFVEKLRRAHEAGASGVVVISDSDMPINPSASLEDLEDVGESLDDVAIVVLRESDGRQVSAMLDVAENHHTGRVVLALENLQRDTVSPGQEPGGEQSRLTGKPVLYINGHALLNTRLLV
jgi:ER degradation enhancer, mannosidase alpha-like 1